MELFLSVIGYIFVFMNGLVAGWFMREKYAQLKVNRYLAAFEEANTITEENTILIDVHKEHEQFYIYDKHNGKFITQVNTKQEMFDYFKNNYPNKNVVMTNDQLSVFDTV